MTGNCIMRKSSRFGFTPAEHRISALPSTLASVVVLGVVAFSAGLSWSDNPTQSSILTGVSLLGIAYVGFFNWVVVPSTRYNQTQSWANAILSSLGLALLAYVAAGRIDLSLRVLIVDA